ncbi:hypothetical protein [Actinoplanes sp. TFC3]|uniref:hypothetical protein n=1 Tax=Actinoplanes sp. TFC3 TaxID=1710355 RepID=UPI0009E94ECC|nr:hypothetical protein [Actinoplanes sp. TFC3]
MAAKGWMTQVGAAAGVAAGTGAAQLGLGYGLGVVVWPTAAIADDSVWLGSLGWATWIAASATVLGAVIAARLGRADVGPWRFALAASAAVGALLTVALIALPARAAVRPDSVPPQTIAAGYALIGVVLGLVIAYWAVVSRPAAANLIATATWLWILAVAAVVLDVFWHRPSATYLASWQFAATQQGGMIGTIYWPSALLTLLAAFAIGVLGAWAAARRKDFGIGTAASGAVGPLLVAGAFLVLAPRLTSTSGSLGAAYLIAPYAVLAGLAGSALTVAVVRRWSARRAVTGQVAATGRAKAPTVPQPRPSTVTPPPSKPKIAQINPPGAVPSSNFNATPASPSPASASSSPSSLASSSSAPPPLPAQASATSAHAAASGVAAVPATRPGNASPRKVASSRKPPEDTASQTVALPLEPAVPAKSAPAKRASAAKRPTARKIVSAPAPEPGEEPPPAPGPAEKPPAAQ